ncbi:MAG: methionyl-tRNA formyltransferase [Gammaproteobacteria bacterium]
MNKSLNVLFAGTPDFSVPCLAVLHSWCEVEGHTLAGVWTQPDRPAGRGRSLRQSPVKEYSITHKIPVFQPKSLKNDEALNEMDALKPDLLVVVAYGLLLPQSVLDLPTFGCINVHASLLPRWRGAAPIQRAVAAGDTHSGVAIMQMDIGLDTGDVWRESRIELAPDETGGSLHDRLSERGAETLAAALPDIVNRRTTPTPQPEEGVTYAHKLTKAEALIDWSLSAQDIERQVRAFNPWPVSHTVLGDKSVRIFAAHFCAAKSAAGKDPGTVISVEEGLFVATGDGVLHVTELQPAGKRAMSAADFLNAHPILNQRFG